MRGNMTVVVPLAPSHVNFLPGLFEQLTPDAGVIDRVIVCRSQLKKRQQREFLHFLRGLANRAGLKVSLSADDGMQLAGENRNKGLQLADTEYTAFLDADDHYMPQRLTRITQTLRSSASDLLLHDFLLEPTYPPTFSAPVWTNSDFVVADRLFQSTFPYGRQRNSEGTSPGDTNIQLPDTHAGHQVAHGHMTIRTELRRSFAFGTLHPGEDGQFCRDLLWAGKAVVYIFRMPSRRITHLCPRRPLSASATDWQEKSHMELSEIGDSAVLIVRRMLLK